LAFISSPFHEEAVDVLDPYVDAFKIASYELTHTPLLRAATRPGKPIIASTGCSTLQEIDEAVSDLQALGCDRLALLQCTAAYPAPLHALDVRSLVTLHERYQVPTGLSDHSADPIVAPMTAAALGASLLEKHFTLSRRLPGPDHAFAVEPHELARMVSSVRAVEQSRGSGAKAVHPIEEELRTFARRSLFTIRPIAAHEVFTRGNIDVLRQGKLGRGLPPRDLDRVLGRRARRDLNTDAPLTEDDIDWAD
jgi:sialic acid synthase SpsE